MDTIDFIRHHTRLILRETNGSGENRATSGSGSTSGSSSTPSAGSGGGGDFEGKYSRAVRGGRASNAAKRAEGLAKSNPQQLLKNLGMTGYTTTGNTKIDEVLNFLKKFRGATPQISAAFEEPKGAGGGVDIPVASLGREASAISEFQAARYVKAALIAGFITGLIDFDPATAGNKVQTRSVDDAGTKKYFVRVTMEA